MHCRNVSGVRLLSIRRRWQMEGRPGSIRRSEECATTSNRSERFGAIHMTFNILRNFASRVRDHLATPYAVQWMRFDDDCPLPDLVKTVSHVAFEVDDLEAAIRGKNVIISPNQPSEGVRVAFIEAAGAPIEFLQITK